MRAGFKMVTAQFLDVTQQETQDGDGLSTDTGFPIQDLTPIASAENVTVPGDGTLEIQILNEDGYAEASYSWYDSVNPFDPTDVKKGWYGQDIDPETGKLIKTKNTIKAGEGLWFWGVDGVSIQSSGKVRVKDVKFQLAQSGFRAIANPYPTEIKIQEITPVAAEGATIPGDGSIEIQVLAKDGYAEASYSWYDSVNPFDQTDVKKGWYGADIDPETGKLAKTNSTIKPGEGVWVWGTATTQYLQLPAPEL